MKKLYPIIFIIAILPSLLLDFHISVKLNKFDSLPKNLIEIEVQKWAQK